MLKRLGLRTKLVLMLLIPLLLLLLTNAYGLQKMSAMQQNLIVSLHDSTYRSSEALLNADRDLYQALVAAEKLLLIPAGTGAFASAEKDIQDNLAQAKERVQDAEAIWKQNQDQLLAPDAEARLAAQFSLFGQEIAAWESGTAEVIRSLDGTRPGSREAQAAKLDGLDKTFGTARNALNELEEIVGANAGQQIEQTMGSMEALKLRLAIVVLLAGLVIVALGWMVSQDIRRSVGRVVEVANRVSEGDLAVPEIPVTTKDEIGRLAASINGMTRNLRDLIAAINTTAMQVAASSQELSASSEETGKASEHIARNIQQIASDAETQRISVSTGFDNLQEISEAARRISESLDNVSGHAGETSGKTAHGNERIRAAVGRMTSIGRSVSELGSSVHTLGAHSQEIERFAQTISALSNQTNLLALNAAIEAARAGEQGLGFAVVAAEVRKLAEQSSNAAMNVTELVQNMLSVTSHTASSMKNTAQEVEQGITAVNEADASFTEIQESIGEVVAYISRISGDTREMSEGASQVNAAFQEIGAIMDRSAGDAQSVSAASEEQLATMEDISSSARAMSRMAEELQELILRFKL
ncbi:MULTISPECIES: methyl-accepting chemotaxis protein [Paenibacillus]|uniref:methyl-accepting chemotaxis protein n=1 Tax=Paenibacillus TaxID=44249 RepID=UPI0022B922C5|nr:methyl-accepting chemotaxis protein [Paenibacillus caseinilyticus]MCZ8518614.1 methyl-accepting chemotaxis protein [Paenibacillus caseinilyticus]